MIFELRQYRIKKGMRPEWVKLMDEVIIPFQRHMGMVIIGSFIVPEDKDLYIWIRRFDSEEQRNVQYDKVYGSSHWKNEIQKAMGDMLIKKETKVRFMEATPGSDLR